MKLPCEMVQDLLPLYHDGVCSEVSAVLVGEHLKECDSCNRVLKQIETEVKMPKLDADEAKPLKRIRSKWTKMSWLKGIVIGVVVFLAWVRLTQTNSVMIEPEEYTITNVCRFSNGMYYLEYRIPYDFDRMGADCCRSDDGSIHIREYRPILARKDAKKGVVRDYLIDPENNIMYTDSGKEVPLTAFYLGCPDRGDAVLLWSADMDVPLASEEMEKEHLYQFVFR